MLICLIDRAEIGQVVIINQNLITGERYPDQPVRIIREVTRQEFIDYWMERDQEGMAKAYQSVGPPPIGFFYAEILTD